VTNNRPGAEAAATRIAELAITLDYTHIYVGYEATGLLWLPVYRFFSMSSHLASFQVTQVYFNPKLVTDFKDALVLRHPKKRRPRCP
jgi:hypothetical protein